MTPCHRAAKFYALLGWNPLPSRSDRKGPAVAGYARYRDGEPIPREWLEDWKQANVQVCLGVPWGLAVIDLDGFGLFTWRAWVRRHGCPDTWTVRTGSGGTHFWFRLPSGISACPSRKVWGIPDGDHYRKHQFIELLGDKSLIIAPPSKHVDTGKAYRFVDGHGPRNLKRPAEIPQWVLDLPAIPRLETPKRPSPPLLAGSAIPLVGITTCSSDRNATMEMLEPSDRMRIARAWGVRFTGYVCSKGWAECHAIGREDAHPSAGLNLQTGVYSEPFVTSLSFLDVAVALGVARDWKEALHAIRESI